QRLSSSSRFLAASLLQSYISYLASFLHYFILIVLPVFAASRAASITSATTTFTSNDDGPSGFNPSNTTARKYRNSSSAGGTNAGACTVFASLSSALRTSIPRAPTVITSP